MGSKTLATCEYCGESWLESEYEWPKDKCEKCGDTQLRRKRVETGDYFGYHKEVDKKKRSS
jgi:uncharacterized protein (DUF983 family)